MTAAGRAAAAPAEGRSEAPFLRAVAADTGFGLRLRDFLAAQGLACDLHGDADALLEGLTERPPRLVLLAGGDLAGPISALRRLRAASRVPCVLLAGGLDENGGAVARDAGADDAADLSAPLPAVLARVRAVLRRAEWGVADAPAPERGGLPAVVALDGWRLLPDRRQLLRPDGRECPLTSAEFDLVRVLVERRGRAVSRDAIARAVFGRPFRPDDRTVDNLVLRLRRKLDAAAAPRAIRTVRGAGYLFAGFGAGERGEEAGRAA